MKQMINVAHNTRTVTFLKYELSIKKKLITMKTTFPYVVFHTDSSANKKISISEN